MTPPITIGTDIFSGEVVQRQLAEITHTLVAGQTGAGKSVLLHALITQLASLPAECEKLYLIDFKGGVEFWRYRKRGPHVQVIWEFAELAGVVTDLLAIMQQRQATMREMDLRQWLGPRVFVVIDEYSEIHWCEADKKARAWVLDALNRLAARSRSAGIVLVAATQKPTTDAMDSAFSGNLPTKFCFRAASNLVASMVLGSLEDLRRDSGLDLVSLRRGWCVFRDGLSGEARYLQPHISLEAS